MGGGIPRSTIAIVAAVAFAVALVAEAVRPDPAAAPEPAGELGVPRAAVAPSPRPSPELAPAVADDAWVDEESGLWTWDSRPGSGTRVVPGRVAVVDFTIWLADGTRRFSTLDHRSPLRFVVGGGAAMPGLDEAVRSMRPGGRRQLRVPADLAFGSVAGTPLPSDTELRVELELVDVLVPRDAPPVDLAFGPVVPGIERAVIALGDGAPVGPTVELDYAMWVEDGEPEPIVQSYDRVEPLTAPLDALLPGWSRGIEGMRAGSHFVLRIIDGLGPEGRPPLVPPGATLLVEVSLRR